MDFLPFEDERVGADYIQIVEKLVDDQCGSKTTRDELHPEVNKLLGKLKMEQSRFGSLYEIYSHYDGGQGWKRKRSEVEEATLEEYQRKHPRIDLARYDLESSKFELLGTIDSYLKHQSLVLDRCISKTILTQWAINNDYVESATETLQDRIDEEESQLENLEKYRQMIQTRSKPEFGRLREEWKQQLVKNASGFSG